MPSSSNILVEKKCDYIVSIKVPYFQGNQRNHLFNDFLGGLNGSARGLRVNLVITTLGVKVYRDKIIRLGHSTAHILSSAFSPQKKLFAYVSKSYSIENIIIYQAHIFKLRKYNDLHILKEQLQRCFDANSRLLRSISFEESDSFIYSQHHSTKLWSRTEHHKGHDSLDYVKRVCSSKTSFDNDILNKENEVNLLLEEYDIIELEVNLEDEFKDYEIIDDAILQKKIILREDWLLPKNTSSVTIAKRLLTAPIGSYFVTPHQTRENQFFLYLKVPKHIQSNELLPCVIIREKPEKFKLQGFTDSFQTLYSLVKYYGSIHDCQLQVGIDHTDSTSSIASLQKEEDWLTKCFDVNDDYEVYESAQSLFEELQKFLSKKFLSTGLY